jgi:hypothetical protein
VRKLHGRLTYANVVCALCLFVSLGGAAFAAVTLTPNSVRSEHIKDGQVKRADLARGSVATAKVRNRSLRARDFKPRQLANGRPGPQGPRGAPGQQGRAGTDGAPATTRFAYVRFTAPATYALGYGSGVAEVTNRNAGRVDVRFNRAVQGCTAHATPGTTASASGAVDAVAIASELVDGDDVVGSEDDVIRVVLRRDNNDPTETSFFLTLVC